MKKWLLILICLFCFIVNTQFLYAEILQKEITAKQAVTLLMDGNKRFITAKSVHPNSDSKQRVKIAKEGQKPFATILTCSDSRVPPELLFDRGFGDIFVIRIAGNIANIDEIGSIEYGVEHLGTPVIIVLGHTKCGAVTAVVKKIAADENIMALLENIRPSVIKAMTKKPALNGDALIDEAVKLNIFQSIDDIYKNSEIIREKVKEGKLKIISALYNIETGKVTLLETDLNQHN
ncbi:MAG: carbonic anhydrase [Candidatus Margulisiibacteriota bacterium]|jgi:carbonic anhydrase